jgi:hypothetical protein
LKKLFNLGRVKQIVEEALGLDISYAYDDVLFVEHSALVIVFDHDNLNKFKCYFNVDCPPDDRLRIFTLISGVSPRNNMIPVNAGTFTLEQLEGEEIKLSFNDDAS